MDEGATTARAALLAAGDWQALALRHAVRADELTAEHRARRARGDRHAVDDFLYEYYGTRPAVLGRWHPGAGVALEHPADGPAEHVTWRWYVADARSVRLDVTAWWDDRGDGVRHIHRLLSATAGRPAFAGCLGLHEWAMVYRQEDGRRRHALPLRLGRAGTDAVVEAHPIRCSHIDAFRFFTPEAVGLNHLQPTRATQVDLEQPGCLHANMDLLKWALKLGPAVPGDLLLDCFELARDIRRLDMAASPYDVTSLGLAPVAIETAPGRAEYVAAQRGFAVRAAALRERLMGVTAPLLAEHG